jgi:hypothetical protein
MEMDPTKMYETEDIYVDRTDPNVSEETIDEYTLDMDAMKKYLDAVYANTKDREEFKTLYEYAAALMFSTNPEIGLAVLMSYDYLAWFFICYRNFMQNPDTFNDTEEYYCKLIARISNK